MRSLGLLDLNDRWLLRLRLDDFFTTAKEPGEEPRMWLRLWLLRNHWLWLRFWLGFDRGLGLGRRLGRWELAGGGQRDFGAPS